MSEHQPSQWKAKASSLADYQNLTTLVKLFACLNRKSIYKIDLFNKDKRTLSAVVWMYTSLISNNMLNFF